MTVSINTNNGLPLRETVVERHSSTAQIGETTWKQRPTPSRAVLSSQKMAYKKQIKPAHQDISTNAAALLGKPQNMTNKRQTKPALQVKSTNASVLVVKPLVDPKEKEHKSASVALSQNMTNKRQTKPAHQGISTNAAALLVKPLEDPEEKKLRRRKRREQRKHEAAIQGAIAGGIVLGPLGMLVGGSSAAAIAHGLSKIGERRKDARVTRQLLARGKLRRAQSTGIV